MSRLLLKSFKMTSSALPHSAGPRDVWISGSPNHSKSALETFSFCYTYKQNRLTVFLGPPWDHIMGTLTWYDDNFNNDFGTLPCSDDMLQNEVGTLTYYDDMFNNEFGTKGSVIKTCFSLQTNLHHVLKVTAIDKNIETGCLNFTPAHQFCIFDPLHE